MEQGRNGASKDYADDQMLLCCRDLQSLKILDTTRRDTPPCRQPSVLSESAGVSNSKTTISGAVSIFNRTRRRLLDGVHESRANDSPKGFLDRVESFHRRSGSDNLITSFSAAAAVDRREERPSPSPALECDGLDQIDVWVPPFDLEQEDPQWGDDADGHGGLGPDFPSPSYRTLLGKLRVRTPKMSLCPSFKRILGIQQRIMASSSGSPAAGSLLELSPRCAVVSPWRTPRADEPLFWPFDRTSYWQPEFEGNYLGISPRESVMLRMIKKPSGRRHAQNCQEIVSAALKTHNGGADRTSLQLQGYMRSRLGVAVTSSGEDMPQQDSRRSSLSAPSPSLHKAITQQAYRRIGRLQQLSSLRSKKPAAPAPAKNTRARVLNIHLKAPQLGRAPPRLSKSSAANGSSEKSAGSVTSKKRGKERRNSGLGKKKRGRDQTQSYTSTIQYLLEFEASGGHFWGGRELPIESLVGLEEFDGQEGALGKTRS